MHHHQAVFAAGFVIVISLLSLLINNPSITGNVLKTESCGELGCYNYCEQDSDCPTSEVCCPTAYKQGVCFYEEQCNEVTQRFNQKTKEMEQPTPLKLDFINFTFPMMILFLALFIIVAEAKQRKH